MLIALDAGHYLGTPGKRCLKSIDPNETREWVLNSRVADKVQKILSGYDVEIIRMDDPTGKTDVTLDERCSKANKAKADLYLSIHHNAGINGGSGGGIVMYAWNVDPGEESLRVRDTIYQYTVSTTGLKGNRANPLALANYQVLRETNMPAVLGEFGFMDSTTDTPIILTEKFADQCANGIAAALVELYDLQPTNATTVVSLYDGVYDFQPEEISIEVVDAPKTSLQGNYCNAGYFGNYEEGDDPFTLPSGHLVADMETKSKWAAYYLEERGEIKDGKAVFDSSIWEYMNPLYGKAVTTLLLQDGKASIQEVQKLPVCDYAVAGIPVLRDGKKVDLGTVLAQGWDKSSLRATSHIFVGLKEGKLHIMGLETKTVDLLTEAGDLFLKHGFSDVMKLDGGGSYIIQSNVIQSQTAEDRRICSIIRFGPCKMKEVEPVDEEYEKFKTYMDRYRAELGQQQADPWAVPYIAQAIDAGLMAEVNGSIERPKDFVTREELATVAAALSKK